MKKAFVYSFKTLDLKTGMYAVFGMSMKSEKEAFDKAMEMLAEINKSIVVTLESIRLDKYYSSPSWVIEQKREDRIETAIACTNIWHNLFRLYED